MCKAVSALKNIAFRNPDNRVAAANHGGIQVLVGLLRVSDERKHRVIKASGVLSSGSQVCCTQIIAQATIPILRRLAYFGENGVKALRCAL